MSAPKLRFKEFDGDWTLDKVGKFLIEYKQKVPSSTDIEIYSSSRNGLKPQKEYFDNRELQNFGEYGVVPPNYLTYRHMSDDTTFKFNINLIGKKIVVSKEYPVFTTNEFMDSSFLLFKLNESNDFKKFAIEQKKGGTRTRLYFKALCTWETLLPTKEEQTKIANFLSAVDEKIAQLSQKLHLLEQYKQGMMQQLFSQQIRFKADDGSDFEEWIECKLGEISTTFSGGTPKSTNKEFFIGTIPFIKSGEISKKYTDQFINELALKESSAKLVKKGDLLYALYGATSGQVALSQIDGAINQAVLCIRSNLNIKYLLNFFLWKKDSILSTYLQGGQGNLSAAILKEILIPVPCLEEQTKIANFLSAIDQKMNVVSEQLKQAQNWKKGLLQQMFV